MVICDHVQESCFEPHGNFKEPCPHAVAHEAKFECQFGRCERLLKFVDGVASGVIFVKHVEIE